MANKISSKCIACGNCNSECPTDAIKEGEPTFRIDPNTCIDCGACAAVCLTGAIEAA